MRALVTGVSRGIGRSICVKLASDALAQGQTPYLVATATGKSPDLSETVKELQEMGCQALGITGDLTDADAAAEVVQQALAFTGGLDALVNNAGFPIVGTLLDAKIRHWDLMFAINVRAMLLLGRAAHAALSESGGAICAIASTSAEMVSPGLTGYSASKAALVALVQQMAYEWGPDGIRVNCVSPGITRSRSTEAQWEDPDLISERANRLPARRLGLPEDIAAAVAFLVGTGSGFITGENLNVDGGLRHIGMEYMFPASTDYLMKRR